MSWILFGWAAIAGVFLFSDDTPDEYRPYLAGAVALLVICGTVLEAVEKVIDTKKTEN